MTHLHCTIFKHIHTIVLSHLFPSLTNCFHPFYCTITILYRISHYPVILLHVHVRFNRPINILFYRDSDIALSHDHQHEEHGAENLQSMQQTPAIELKGRLKHRREEKMTKVDLFLNDLVLLKVIPWGCKP